MLKEISNIGAFATCQDFCTGNNVQLKKYYFWICITKLRLGTAVANEPFYDFKQVNRILKKVEFYGQKSKKVNIIPLQFSCISIDHGIEIILSIRTTNLWYGIFPNNDC